MPPEPRVAELEAEVERTKQALARVASWFLTGHEPTNGELREELVRGGLDGPDALSAALHPEPTEENDGR